MLACMQDLDVNFTLAHDNVSNANMCMYTYIHTKRTKTNPSNFNVWNTVLGFITLIRFSAFGMYVNALVLARIVCMYVHLHTHCTHTYILSALKRMRGMTCMHVCMYVCMHMTC
jgi:hypothetical protein